MPSRSPLRHALLPLLLVSCASPPSPDETLGTPVPGDTAVPADSADPHPDDLDGDGYPAPEDCDDDDPTRSPGATEVCDGVDQDCDGLVDDDAQNAPTWYADADGDGFGDPLTSYQSCTGGVEAGADCDDGDSSIHPGAPEVCRNATDDNCDTYIDEMVAGITHLTIQAAIDDACAPGDVVWVAAGTYVENLLLAEDRPVALASIDGYDSTTVDGSACTTGPDTCATITVLAHRSEIRGLRITGGSGQYGGGIATWVTNDVRIEGNLIDANHADGGGGGLYLYGGGHTVRDNDVRENTAAGDGGGIELHAVGDPDEFVTLLENNTFADNRGDNGGGAYDATLDGRAMWIGNTFTGNVGALGGGVLGVYTLETTSNTITGNTATDAGGGVWVSSYWTWSSAGDTITGNTPDDVACGEGC